MAYMSPTALVGCFERTLRLRYFFTMLAPVSTLSSGARRLLRAIFIFDARYAYRDPRGNRSIHGDMCTNLTEFAGEARKAGGDETSRCAWRQGNLCVVANSSRHIYGVFLSQNFCEIVTPLFSQLWRGSVASAFLPLPLFFI